MLLSLPLLLLLSVLCVSYFVSVFQQTIGVLRQSEIEQLCIYLFKYFSRCICLPSSPSPPFPSLLPQGQGEGLGLEDVIIAGSFDIGGYDCKLTQTLVQRKIPLQYMEEDADVNDPPPYPGKAFVIGNWPTEIRLTALDKAFVIGYWLTAIRLTALDKAFVIGNWPT